MLDSNDLALWCALNRLISNYWADVDENGGHTAHEFYVPEGLYAIGNNRFEGQEQIQAFYARRRYGTRDDTSSRKQCSGTRRRRTECPDAGFNKSLSS